MRLEFTWSADAQEIAKPVISNLPGLGGGDGQLTSGQPLTDEWFVVKIRKALAASIMPLDKNKNEKNNKKTNFAMAR